MGLLYPLPLPCTILVRVPDPPLFSHFVYVRPCVTKCILWYLKNKRPTWGHLLFYFTSYVLNMFRTLICPSSGACDYSVELPHWSYCSCFDVCWNFGVVGLEWYPCCRLMPATRIPHRTKNKTTNVVIQQNSRKVLMMDILMSETCWAHKKWNKIASAIKLVFYSSTITMMHGPINMSPLIFTITKERSVHRR